MTFVLAYVGVVVALSAVGILFQWKVNGLAEVAAHLVIRVRDIIFIQMDMPSAFPVKKDLIIQEKREWKQK